MNAQTNKHEHLVGGSIRNHPRVEVIDKTNGIKLSNLKQENQQETNN